MNRPLLVIFLTVGLDAMGIGLIIPVIPVLLKELTGQDEIHFQNGFFLAIYALMQFVFSPVLGLLSDWFGRRPVLLVSLAGAAIDYLVMGLTHDLWILFVGRAIAGITGANMAVATSYIADVTEESLRARRYGLMNACFGLGFVAGPILGGYIGEGAPRNPFLMAAVLNGLTFALGLFFLPESHKVKTVTIKASQLNPLGPLAMVFSLPGILPLLAVFFIMHMVGQFPATLWVIHGQNTFGWSTQTVGHTLAFFGIVHATFQATLTEPMTKRLGEKWAILVAILFDGSGMLLLAMATQTATVIPVMVLLCLGGIALPALQSLLSKQVEENQQGELQGTLVSLMSLTSIFGPLGASWAYGALPLDHRGWVWAIGGGLYLLCIPAFAMWRSRKAQPLSNDGSPGASGPESAGSESTGQESPRQPAGAIGAMHQ